MVARICFALLLACLVCACGQDTQRPNNEPEGTSQWDAPDFGAHPVEVSLAFLPHNPEPWRVVVFYDNGTDTEHDFLMLGVGEDDGALDYVEVIALEMTEK